MISIRLQIHYGLHKPSQCLWHCPFLYDKTVQRFAKVSSHINSRVDGRSNWVLRIRPLPPDGIYVTVGVVPVLRVSNACDLSFLERGQGITQKSAYHHSRSCLVQRSHSSASPALCFSKEFQWSPENLLRGKPHLGHAPIVNLRKVGS